MHRQPSSRRDSCWLRRTSSPCMLATHHVGNPLPVVGYSTQMLPALLPAAHLLVLQECGDKVSWPAGYGGLTAGISALLRETAAVCCQHLRLLCRAHGWDAIPQHRPHEARGGGVLDSSPRTPHQSGAHGTGPGEAPHLAVPQGGERAGSEQHREGSRRSPTICARRVARARSSRTLTEPNARGRGWASRWKSRSGSSNSQRRD